ncbi:hypothetical protein Raf01_80940 [Rugosimonospora africana]|uniref:Uncharacterized protein n=1 Tax=Rugosimonospora africana TaxID=556532 RepID=A0A8J3R1L0_9ACTN|nr:hypothetical protein Raf01_80940 [Rugosimonospora africana]
MDGAWLHRSRSFVFGRPRRGAERRGSFGEGNRDTGLETDLETDLEKDLRVPLAVLFLNNTGEFLAGLLRRASLFSAGMAITDSVRDAIPRAVDGARTAAAPGRARPIPRHTG